MIDGTEVFVYNGNSFIFKGFDFLNQNELKVLPPVQLQLPVVALRGLTVMPGETVHFDIGRPKSYEAVRLAMRQNKRLFIVSQRNPDDEDPEQQELYKVGVVAEISRMARLPEKNCHLLVQGVQRAYLNSITDNGVFLLGTVTPMVDEVEPYDDSYADALCQVVYNDYENLLHFYPKLALQNGPDERMRQQPAELSDSITALLPLDFTDKQQVLSETKPLQRLELVRDLLEKQYQICLLENKIGEKTRAFIDEGQREYYLREQIRAIHSELYGEGNEPEDELNTYYEKIEKLHAPKEVTKLLRAEVKKLGAMPPGAQESAVIRTYLDTCLQLPYNKADKLNTNIQAAAVKLDKEHYGLQKVKEQILENLAVLTLKPDAKGNIICLAGPPGVGKTSIARSLAESMGRKFERISLGGIADESEIRGHRKTYLGSMPGKLIKAMTHAGTMNPLILLDEIDKLGKDYKGDPAAALLEALDPEQNATFTDHYIDFPFDLSGVLFVTTANNIQNVPDPLRDRMDVIELPGYTREDKIQIATGYLYKKQLECHGLTVKQLTISKPVFGNIADYYTREAGVRSLERSIAAICRKAARRVAEGETEKIRVTPVNLKDYLGARKFTADELLKESTVGVVNGLAWTAVGGTLMQLEAAAIPGNGKVVLTGSLGDVMQESATTAVSFVRAHAAKFGIDAEFYKKLDIHIHATEAAVPKDGPSAGVTMVTAVVSALTGRAVERTVGMTGEITLLGRVLPIGGLKEKSMAAYRAGIKTVFIPQENKRDLAEIDPIVLQNITFVPVSRVEQVLEGALLPSSKKASVSGKTSIKKAEKLTAKQVNRA